MTSKIEKNLAPEVSPADLQSVWLTLQELKSHSEPGLATSTNIELLQQVCSEGADAEAVWARTLILRIFSHVAPGWMEREKMGKVIEVAARFPMKMMRPGVEQDEPPFDVREFMKQVAAAR